MDVAAGMVMGTALRWIYDALKNRLGLKDMAAAWGAMICSLLAAGAYTVINGGFAGLPFDPSNPIACLESITAAWGTVFATASAWYPLTKNRTKK